MLCIVAGNHQTYRRSLARLRLHHPVAAYGASAIRARSRSGFVAPRRCPADRIANVTGGARFLLRGMARVSDDVTDTLADTGASDVIEDSGARYVLRRRGWQWDVNVVGATQAQRRAPLASGAWVVLADRARAPARRLPDRASVAPAPAAVLEADAHHDAVVGTRSAA